MAKDSVNSVELPLHYFYRGLILYVWVVEMKGR